MFRATPSRCFRRFQLRGKETPGHASGFRKPPSHPAANMYVLHITIVDKKNIIDCLSKSIIFVKAGGL